MVFIQFSSRVLTLFSNVSTTIQCVQRKMYEISYKLNAICSVWSSIVPRYLDVVYVLVQCIQNANIKRRRKKISENIETKSERRKNKWLRDAKLAWEKWDGYIVVCSVHVCIYALTTTSTFYDSMVGFWFVSHLAWVCVIRAIES